MSLLSATAPPGQLLTSDQADALIRQACGSLGCQGKKVLLIIPDGTRTAPIGLAFRAIHAELGPIARALDVLIALGTHQPMSEQAIRERLEISESERQGCYGKVRFFNHAWDRPEALVRVGTLKAEEVREITGGLFAMDVPVEVNRLLFDYDQVIIVGPVFPHEVVGFSGGNKYLFPGVGGPQILNFFHWLGAVITTPRVIGNQWTPVRRVVDRAGALVDRAKFCFCLVVDGKGLAGLFAGSPEAAWTGASELSRERHIVYKAKPYHTILACAPPMYDEIWTAGKCMYKLEPVLADSGELIIFAPHIEEFSLTHGHLITKVGYHCRDYFLRQWERFRDLPWGVLAHSTHVFGLGDYNDGVEKPRARVTLATQISPELCHQVNLGYRDPGSINPASFANREAEGVLMVPKAGEILYRLTHPPPWASA